MPTKISWATETWSPITGCSPISPGCDNCYAARMAKRLAGRFGYPKDDPFAVTFHPDKLNDPLKWKNPHIVFVCSMGDLFHDDVTLKYLVPIFDTIDMARRHTFLILTKRPNYMKRIFEHLELLAEVTGVTWPPPNVWLGVTAENQQMADERIPILLSIPATKHFVSVEPMLGPVFFAHYGGANAKIDWVICGGETGPGARPVSAVYVRSLRDQCVENGIPFHFKSWGECKKRSVKKFGWDESIIRELDGVLWDQFPEVNHHA